MNKRLLFQIIMSALSILILACEKESSAEPSKPIDSTPKKESYSFIYNDKSYDVVKEASTWLNAANYAVEQGGYLAEIGSEAEHMAIYIALLNEANITFDETENQFGFAAVWLGGSDMEEEGKWVWNGDNDNTKVQFWQGDISGSEVNGLYNNWGNEPDNNGNQDALCVGLETTPINASGQWTDLDGEVNQLFFVIEYD